jgi:hypothetical protein
MSTLRSVARPLAISAIPSYPLTFVTSNWTLAIPPDAYTMEGFRKWATADDFPDHVRVTFLQGEIIIDRSKEELETHNKLKLEIYRVLSNLLVEFDMGEFYADGALVTNPGAEVSNNPDAVFVAWDTLDAGRVHLVPRRGEARATHRDRRNAGLGRRDRQRQLGAEGHPQAAASLPPRGHPRILADRRPGR